MQVSYESIRRWRLKFGPQIRQSLKHREGRLGDTWYLDEIFITINGQVYYLWRAVDQDDDVVDILVQHRRNAQADKRFYSKALKGQGAKPRWITTDKPRSYLPAVRDILPEATPDTRAYANNRAELSHRPTRQRERQMRGFKSRHQAQRFLALHARVNNLFRYGRHLVRTVNHRLLRERAFMTWRQVTCAC